MNTTRYPPDYHTHTALCKHAQGGPAQYVRAAVAAGVREIAITDHCPAPTDYDAPHRMTLAEYPRYVRMVDEARQVAGCDVLFGIEADYYEGCVPFLERWLPEQSFDLVLGSVHCLDFWSLEDPVKRKEWDSKRVSDVWKRYFELLGRLADSRLYDIVSHLDLPKRSGVRPDEAEVRDDILPALDRIAASGMAIEINTSGLRHPVREMYPSPTILGWARERGIPIVFGSDAHEPDNVGGFFPRAVELARSAGYTTSARFRKRRRELVPLP